MKIHDMFQRDITRDINGVVKVSDDDDLADGNERHLVSELDEYVITNELRNHFRTFFDNYKNAIDCPTDKVGVWISGFFGSGKSHFLKMLSYLLSNRVVDGRHTIDIFKDKFNDAMLYADVVRCANIATESISFNIDIYSRDKDNTAIRRVFTSVFYNHLGFYGNNLKVARFERNIDKFGKTDEFRKAFEALHGKSWVESRDTFSFLEDRIVPVLQNVLNMSETAARDCFKTKNDDEITIKQLVEEIKEYVDGKGKDFRLLFCVDEVGQYIGDDSNLMLNLQSFVEEVGSKCRGKVWVMVTSQEAIDSVVKVCGNDFSKIMGRFDTRLSLTSASADEVIKKRILEKRPNADNLLRLVYNNNDTILKNLFTFTKEHVADIKGYTDEKTFSETYPFVPYQFIIIQKVLNEIRKHGNSGKHLSSGERSMLSGFQEAAQTIKDNDENALVPFWLFYSTVNTSLESEIRQVIDRCEDATQKKLGLEQYDVSVLKLLYLVRYIDDFATNIDNIAILMIDDIRTEKMELRSKIAESLVRLERQNYIARNGDNYFFLTNEEQDIAKEIRNTIVDSADIVKSIGHIIFEEIYTSKKYKFNNKNDFAYNRYVDNIIHGTLAGEKNNIGLRFITEASDDYNAPEEKLNMNSLNNKEAIVRLSGEARYFNDLETAAKIRKYIKTQNISLWSLRKQEIINGQQKYALALEKNVTKQINSAIADATFYVHGQRTEIKYGNAKEKIDDALKQLIECVYSKLNYVNTFSDSDTDIQTLLNGEPRQIGIAGSGSDNEFAVKEIIDWLDDRYRSRIPVTMGDVQSRYQDIPYGWREIDIAAITARLIVLQKIEIRYGGAVVGKDDKNLIRYLRIKTEIDKVRVSRRIAPSEDILRKAIKFMRDWLEQMAIPEDEDGLLEFIKNTLNQKMQHYDDLLRQYNDVKYPQKDTVQSAIKLIESILSQKNDNVALLEKVVAVQDNLINTTEDMEEVETFFKSQKNIFDSAVGLQKMLQYDRDCFVADSNINGKISEITNILNMPKPYTRIKDLPNLIQDVKTAYDTVLEQKKNEVRDMITRCMGDVHTLAGVGRATDDVIKSDRQFEKYKEDVENTNDITLLDAMITRMLNHKDTVCKQIELIIAEPSSKYGKIINVRRYEIFPIKQLTSNEEINAYLDGIRNDLCERLKNNDGIQII